MNEKDINPSQDKRKSSPLVLPPPPKASAPVRPFVEKTGLAAEVEQTSKENKLKASAANEQKEQTAAKKASEESKKKTQTANEKSADSEEKPQDEAPVLTEYQLKSDPKRPAAALPEQKQQKKAAEKKTEEKKPHEARTSVEAPKVKNTIRTMEFDIPILSANTPLPKKSSAESKAEEAKAKSKKEISVSKKKAPRSQEDKKKKTIGFSESDYYDYAGFERRKPRSERLTGGKIAGRITIAVASVLLFAIIALYALCFTVAKGPSETVRNLLVLSAKQASATKWVPGLFLDSETIDSIMESSEKVETDVMSIEDYYASKTEDSVTEEKDEWKNAKDGMIFKTLKGSTYSAYMLIVKDPSRIFVSASSENFDTSEKGKNIFEATADYGAVAAINGGEFPDGGGIGTGSRPVGLTYSKGKCVWNDGQKRTFIGFDENNKLIVSERMTMAEAEALGIRDAVSFQTGNVLISSDGENVTFYYAEGNNGTAQRTAIGQRADGAVILLVTDGRSASSLGATHNDVIDIMVEHGAVNAAMLDGGSSSMMYYENYFDKYGYDTDSLDQYQKRGLVNKYKAFTSPRYMPTFIMVAPENGGAQSAE